MTDYFCTRWIVLREGFRNNLIRQLGGLLSIRYEGVISQGQGEEGMKLKKIMSLILVTSMVAAMVLTGCGKKEDTKTTESSGTSTEGEGTESKKEMADKIVIFQSKVEISDQLEALAEEYENETGVKVEVWGTTGDDYPQQIKTKLSNNQGPTIFSLQPGAEVEQLKAYVADLSDLSFVSEIAEGMAPEMDGQIVGIPYTVEGFGVVYNKSFIDPSKVTSYDGFVDMLKDMKDKGINGMSLSQEAYFLIGHILNTPFALQADPAEFLAKLNAGEVKMADTPQFQEFAKFMEAIREYTTNPLEVSYDKETGDFATGKSASIHQGNWCYGMFEDYDIDFDMGIMPLPIDGNDKIAVSVPAAWFVNSQASEAEINAGKAFLEWLYTSDTGEQYLMEEFGFIPVVNGMESPKLDPLSGEISEYTKEGNTLTWPMSDWPAGIVDVYLVPVAEELFTTDMSGEEFLTALDEAWVQANK